MQTVHSLADLRPVVSEWKRNGLSVAFVPTMGNLHPGHISLIQRAREHADRVVSSIFVNPMQFGAGEDFDSYPRTLAEDQLQLEAVSTDLLFAPSVETMYPKPMSEQTQVHVPGLSDILCGASRPGHFTGVATVVCKLFNMVQPDVAVFGRKDYQQLQVIRQMTNDLVLPVKILSAPTFREADGLAMSSRNGYLSQEERRVAPSLYRVLQQAADHIRAGKEIGEVAASAEHALEDAGFRPDYFAIRQAQSLLPVDAGTKDFVLLAAAYLGQTRLIDNLELSL